MRERANICGSVHTNRRESISEGVHTSYRLPRRVATTEVAIRFAPLLRTARPVHGSVLLPPDFEEIEYGGLIHHL
jgi:hypothetical protein